MWHSTQFTRACAPSLCAAISSGCTEWHIVAQNALLLEYSQPAMPAAPTTASPTMRQRRSSVTDPSISVLRPMSNVHGLALLLVVSSAGALAAPLPDSRGAGRAGPDASNCNATRHQVITLKTMKITVSVPRITAVPPTT